MRILFDQGTPRGLARVLAILFIIPVLVRGAEIAAPSQFYIVSAYFSDNGPAFYYRVIEVNQDGPDTRVRYSRIAPVNLYCPRLVVQTAEATLHNASPGNLVKAANPCAVEPGALEAAVKRYRRIEGVFESLSFGVVAQCRSSSVILGLPISQKVDLKRLRSAKPEMARLWDLASGITDSVFEAKDLFHDRTEAEDLALHLAGEKVVPELISGRYDAGLAAALRGNVADWKSPSFRELLASYRGPVSAEQAKASRMNSLDKSFDVEYRRVDEQIRRSEHRGAPVAESAGYSE